MINIANNKEVFMKYFYNYVKKYGDKEIHIYIDMDGVVADYDVLNYELHKEENDVYLTKRPVISSIDALKEVSQLNNVKLYILSVSRHESQIAGKKEWLSKNMDFIKQENINIIPRDSNNFMKAVALKRDFLKNNINKTCINILIDDSHQVLDEVYDLKMDIIPLHITSIID